MNRLASFLGNVNIHYHTSIIENQVGGGGGLGGGGIISSGMHFVPGNISMCPHSRTTYIINSIELILGLGTVVGKQILFCNVSITVL